MGTRTFGGPGNDFLGGDDGPSEIHAGSGDDDIQGDYASEGTGYDDIIFAGKGNDFVNPDPSGTGDDVIHGGKGSDEIRAYYGGGNDKLHGGEGDDTLLAGDGAGGDVVDGGTHFAGDVCDSDGGDQEINCEY